MVYTKNTHTHRRGLLEYLFVFCVPSWTWSLRYLEHWTSSGGKHSCNCVSAFVSHPLCHCLDESTQTQSCVFHQRHLPVDPIASFLCQSNVQESVFLSGSITESNRSSWSSRAEVAEDQGIFHQVVPWATVIILSLFLSSYFLLALCVCVCVC